MTLVVVLMWINAIFEIVLGVLTLIASANDNVVVGAETSDPGLTRSALIWIGIVAIAIGIITILLAMGLARGSNAVRVLVSFLIVVQIIVDVFEVARSHYALVTIIGIILWLLVLALLWTSRASAFFTQRSA